MLLQLETIDSSALAHIDGKHAACLSLLASGRLSWCVCRLYVFVVVDHMQTTVAVPVVEEAILGFVGIWERHWDVSLVQRLFILVLLMTAYLAG